jgi:hypothetical protein
VRANYRTKPIDAQTTPWLRRNKFQLTDATLSKAQAQKRKTAVAPERHSHGLMAATVVTAIEDSQEFERFAAAVRADYQPVSTVEHELVARLASLLWRLRRATLIETNLF